MTIYSTIGSSLSGLLSQSNDLSTISDNIANASTVGFKEGNTNFETLVYAAGLGAPSAQGGVTTTTSLDVGTAGQLQSTGVSTDLAINGGGFMVVNTNANSNTGNYLLTRAGSFRPDANGDLVNAAGYYLQGQPINSQTNTGTPVSAITNLSTVNVSNLSAAGAPTSAMTFTANLPASNTAYSATAATPSTSTETYYDSLGSAQTLTFSFTPTQAASGAAATNTWTMNIYDSASSTPTTAIGSATLVFNGTGSNSGTLSSVTPVGGAGSYSSATGNFTVTTASGQSIPISIGALNSATGMTQFDGNYQTTNVSQNGAAFGRLQGVTIGNDGVVTASFSNGTTRPIYQLTNASGVAQIDIPGQGAAGAIDSGSLEQSNVDITTQLTNMIQTQRAYSSNAMVMQTADQMLDTINRLQA
jgi:flagellar hook protein FlgE